jgi:hypothetical protein
MHRRKAEGMEHGAQGERRKAQGVVMNNEYRTRNFELRTGGYDFFIQNSLFGIRYF